MEQSKIRPTKKQKDLLDFIRQFISEHGYSPSYREIMKGLNYNSVATVALHINNLLKRGQLIKRDHSARSLEVLDNHMEPKILTNQIKESEEKWLIEKVEYAFKQIEQLGDEIKSTSLDDLYVLVGALKILGIEGGAQSFVSRLSILKKRHEQL
ncbi:MAG: hypothetical protein M1554_02780 [Patescibacteria group bacterium]|jgi:repressor LexA|nr:hypothetical protein [Patescibacteria group bacterium]